MTVLKKLVDKLKCKMCCQKIVIRLSLKLKRAEVESSNSVDLQLTGLEVRSSFSEFPSLQQRSIFWNMCIHFSVSTLLSG